MSAIREYSAVVKKKKKKSFDIIFSMQADGHSAQKPDSIEENLFLISFICLFYEMNDCIKTFTALSVQFLFHI